MPGTITASRRFRRSSPRMGSARESPLARYLLAAYLLLVVYASLHPFAGWRDQGLSPLAFLTGAWPRYVTGFDLIANAAGYFPLGALAVLALHPRLRGAGAAAAAILGSAAASLVLEAAQTYLPSRSPSNLDLASNSAGAALGAVVALWASPWLLETGPLRRSRERMVAPGALADAGLVLLALWLFIQLDPTTLLFGAGDLRHLMEADVGRERLPGYFVAVEALIAGANLAATGLLASAILLPRAPARLAIPALVLLALVVRAAAFAILMRAENVLEWLTPGAVLGLCAGLALALAAAALPRTLRLALAAVLLMAATVLVNLAPPNPYMAATLKVWEQGHFLNFNGLTRLVSWLWPFAAIGYAMALAARGSRASVG